MEAYHSSRSVSVGHRNGHHPAALAEAPRAVIFELLGASVTLRGRVEKIISSSMNNLSDAVQTAIEGAEDLYREVRIQNLLRDADGGVIALQPGLGVEITMKVRTGR